MSHHYSSLSLKVNPVVDFLLCSHIDFSWMSTVICVYDIKCCLIEFKGTVGPWWRYALNCGPVLLVCMCFGVFIHVLIEVIKVEDVPDVLAV